MPKTFKQNAPKSKKTSFRKKPGTKKKTSGAKPEKARSEKPKIEEIRCSVAEVCGSCRYINDRYSWSLKKKWEAGKGILQETGAMELAKFFKPEDAARDIKYRSTFKLAVRPQTQKTDLEDRFTIGLFQPGTHRVVDVSRCPVHVFPLSKLLKDIASLLEESELSPYNEETKEGDLRYLVARCSHITDELMITFVMSRSNKKELRTIVSELKDRGNNIHAAFENINSTSGNVILGEKTEKLFGSEKLREKLCGYRLEISPQSFFQVNPWQAEAVYQRIAQIAGEVPEGNAWDLYCGGGIISMLLADNGYQVTGIEENPFAIDDAKENAQRNNLDSRTDFHVGRVEDIQNWVLTEEKNPDVVIVNPSRKGLAEETRKFLANQLGQQAGVTFVYMSCEVKTLARDLEEMTKSGFIVRQVEAFDMFPHTDKLEWLAVMTK